MWQADFVGVAKFVMDCSDSFHADVRTIITSNQPYMAGIDVIPDISMAHACRALQALLQVVTRCAWHAYQAIHSST